MRNEVEGVGELRAADLCPVALAVLFECLPLLRGALGNVVFFFLWGAVLSADIARPDSMREGASGPMFERTASMCFRSSLSSTPSTSMPNALA